MKSTAALFPVAAAAALGCLTAGCVSLTSVKDEPRGQVRFASATAAQVFYDAYASTGSPKGRHEFSVGIPLMLPYQRVKSENVKFNAAVRTADENHDGTISEREARAYAASDRS